jgi:hypothetical protein
MSYIDHVGCSCVMSPQHVCLFEDSCGAGFEPIPIARQSAHISECRASMHSAAADRSAAVLADRALC